MNDPYENSQANKTQSSLNTTRVYTKTLDLSPLTHAPGIFWTVAPRVDLSDMGQW